MNFRKGKEMYIKTKIQNRLQFSRNESPSVSLGGLKITSAKGLRVEPLYSTMSPYFKMYL